MRARCCYGSWPFARTAKIWARPPGPAFGGLFRLLSVSAPAAAEVGETVGRREALPRDYGERQRLYHQGELGSSYAALEGGAERKGPQDLLEEYGRLSGEELERAQAKATVGGRILAFREVGSKLVFIDLYHDGGKIQVIMNATCTAFFDETLGQLQRGDIVQVGGVLCRTRAGELSIRASSITLLAPCLLNIPDIHAPLMTESHRAQQRHLDLLARPSKLEAFRTRSRLVRLLREFLHQRHFIEVETPILATSVGGALAAPFRTSSTALGTELALRIAPELHLKRLIVAGFDRVFELGKVFRNEGVDASHSPEFTMLELYQSFSSVAEMMALAEELLCTALGQLGGPRWDSVRAPFERIDIVPTLESRLGIVFDFADEQRLADQLLAALSLQGIPHASKSLAHMFDRLVGALLEPHCQAPTFLINHPICQSPLAAALPDRPHLAARFELFVGGRELMNGYSELNDPHEQRTRFVRQALDHQTRGDQEAHAVDEDYVRALEVGMPPTGGLGVGIDRFVMLLNDARHMRDVILFPLSRGREGRGGQDSPISDGAAEQDAQV